MKTLEEELVEEARYEQQQRKEVARLTGERETSAREAAKAVKKRKPLPVDTDPALHHLRHLERRGTPSPAELLLPSGMLGPLSLIGP